MRTSRAFSFLCMMVYLPRLSSAGIDKNTTVDLINGVLCCTWWWHTHTFDLSVLLVSCTANDQKGGRGSQLWRWSIVLYLQLQNIPLNLDFLDIFCLVGCIFWSCLTMDNISRCIAYNKGGSVSKICISCKLIKYYNIAWKMLASLTEVWLCQTEFAGSNPAWSDIWPGRTLQAQMRLRHVVQTPSKCQPLKKDKDTPHRVN